MDFNAIPQFPSPPQQGPFAPGQAYRRHSSQVMYPYGSFPQQQSGQSQFQPSTPSQQISHQQSRRNSQPATWNVSNSMDNLSSLQNGTGVKQENAQMPSTEAEDQSTLQQTTFSHDNISGLNMQDSYVQSDMFGTPLMDANTIKTSMADLDMGRIPPAWNTKPFDELEFPLDPDMTDLGQGLMVNDEDGPVIDLRRYYGNGLDNDTFNNRRISESSFSMSSCGAVAEIPNYEDLSSSESTRKSDTEPWPELQPCTSLMSSPQPSPRRNTGVDRTKTSPSPHANMRSSPYTIDRNRRQRWSTGAYASTPTPPSVPARPMSHLDRYAPYAPRFNTHHHMPAYGMNTVQNYPMPSQQLLYSQHQQHHLNPGMYGGDNSYSLEVPRPVPSQGFFRMLQSNSDRHGCSTHFADLSDPPDLYSSLHEEPSNPPEEDMHPEDPDMIPHEQDLRFSGDLYTPRWVRGHGNKREGWCGLCKPGRWLVLKNSAFWYDKSFTHGVSAATGAAFQGPQDKRRTEGNLDVWEGLCGSCGDWIALVSSKKKGTTWFRHAYKCHTHQKVKDGPKRRRETSHQIRARTVSSASTTTTSSYPVSKESSVAPPSLMERSSPSDAGSDSRTATDPSLHHSHMHPIHGSPPITSSELVGLGGGVKSMLAGMV